MREERIGPSPLKRSWLCPRTTPAGGSRHGTCAPPDARPAKARALKEGSRNDKRATGWRRPLFCRKATCERPVIRNCRATACLIPRWRGRRDESDHVSTDFPKRKAKKQCGLPAPVLPAKLINLDHSPDRLFARAREVDSGDSRWTATLGPLCFSLER
jgi:hypothetical protein